MFDNLPNRLIMWEPGIQRTNNTLIALYFPFIYLTCLNYSLCIQITATENNQYKKIVPLQALFL